MAKIQDPLIQTPETIRADARKRDEDAAYEAEMRYARTGLTIDAQRAVEARRIVSGWDR